MKKKKIAILTLTDYDNFGNRLQNYATEKTIIDLGYDVNTIPVLLTPVKKNIMSTIKKVKIKNLGIMLFRVNEIVFRIILHKRYKSKKEKFILFTEKFINNSSIQIVDENYDENLRFKYDFFVTGSDQVWNPNYIGTKQTYFLNFANEYQRIAYAASFGLNKIPEECFSVYKEYLQGIKKLSVREESGAKLIRDMSGTEVEVLLDPTMAVSKNCWELVSLYSDIECNEKYILVYFLGYINRKEKKEIKKIAKKYKLKIVNIMNPFDKSSFEIGPCDFLKYIKNAELIFTNSFHGVVFSIIFEKNFIVAERSLLGEKMSTRIDNLLENFDLNERKYEGVVDYSNLFNIKFSTTREILKLKKGQNLDFLQKSLNMQ